MLLNTNLPGLAGKISYWNKKKSKTDMCSLFSVTFFQLGGGGGGSSLSIPDFVRPISLLRYRKSGNFHSRFFLYL